MSPFSRVLGCLIVLILASCVLPPRGQAAEIRLEWTDNSSGPTISTGCRVYQQVGASWSLVASPSRGNDVNPTTPGLQQSYTVTRGPGTYVFRVTAYNDAGESSPSNTVTPVVQDLPPAPTGLIFTITVP